ncbi:MAG: hypothetical protein OEW11_01210 [Nitrospirota bacterium]|nr:hypothetical protein [Nitrospirota bacterium]
MDHPADTTSPRPLDAPRPGGASPTESERELLQLAVSLLNHDLRSPIHAILGFSELLTMRDGSPEEIHRYAEMIGHGGEQLMHQVDQIVGLMRAVMGQTAWGFAETPLTVILGAVAPEGVVIGVAKGDTTGTVRWDPERMGGALGDLRDHGRQASGDETFAADADASRVRIRIGQPLGALHPVDINFRNAAVQYAAQVVTAHHGTLLADQGGFGFSLDIPRYPDLGA